MDTDITENQQLVSLLLFIKRYKKLFFGALIAIAVLVVGVGMWQQRTQRNAARASEVYQEMLMAEFANDAQAMRAKGQYLIEEYSRTPYAQMAALLLAKNFVKDGDLDQAADQLRWVIKQSSAKNITLDLAKLRLASILQAQNKFDEALKVLSKAQAEAFTALFAEARGDIYVAQQNLEQAKLEYQQAIEALPAGSRAPLLRLKLTDLGVDNVS